MLTTSKATPSLLPRWIRLSPPGNADQFREHEQLILGNASDFVQPDAPRVGGISPFLKIMDLAAKHGRKLAPHFAMEVHLHLSAAYPWSRGWNISSG